MSNSPPDVPIERLKRGSTCFAAHARAGVSCQKSSCRMWVKSGCHQNCTLLAVANHRGCSMTLQQIGDIHGLTRMRVCQIEKRAITKVKDTIFADGQFGRKPSFLKSF